MSTISTSISKSNMAAVRMCVLSLCAAMVAAAPPPPSPPQPDPQCLRGILEESQLVCCAKECGVCGGPTCGTSPGGSKNCCIGAIKASGESCDKQGAPCVVAPAPPPATSCGDYPPPLSSTQPNVMLIGDSISMPPPSTPGGYGLDARELFVQHNVSVWHNGGWSKGGQASNTVKGLTCTDPSTDGNWLNFTGQYDVIHFNFGLHDLVDEGPGEGKEHVDIPQYGKNLVEIYHRLAAKAKVVMWTTTTPCPNVTTSMGRSDAKVTAYNAAAKLALTTEFGSGIKVDDLYSAVDTYCGKNYKTCDLQLPANVHFTPKGCQFMAQEVVKSVMSVLSAPSLRP